MSWIFLVSALVARAPGSPSIVTIASPRGEARVLVRSEPGGRMLAAPALLPALQGTVVISGAWAEVTLPGAEVFRFLLGAPVYAVGNKVRPLAGPATVQRDTLFFPLQFVTEVLPKILNGRYRYDVSSSRLTELPQKNPPVVAVVARDPNRLPNGLRRGHVVTVDAGHGGVDPGNPGMFFPRGIREKDVTLRMALLLRDELKRRGIGVIMTRTTDTLIVLRERAGYCSDLCEMFVSLHINSLPKRPGASRVRGFETYFLAEAKTEDAARVAKMENEAVHFEKADEDSAQVDGLDFLLKDLQLNEHLRESARLAQLVQSHLEEVHTGENFGVKQAGLMVLNTARRPAVLVELGFSTNPEEGRFLTTPSSQHDMAGAVADAVVSYLLEYERRAGATSDSAPKVSRATRP